MLENLAAGYAQDVYPQVLPDPPSYISLLPSDSLNGSMMAVVKDEKAHGTKYTWPHVLHIDLFKVNGNAQGIHLLKISCAPKFITLSFAVYGMLTPLPFDRGKMVSNLSLSCPHAASVLTPPRSLQANFVHPSLPAWNALKEDYCSHVVPYCPWGVINKPMGSTDMHKLYCAQAFAYHSEHLHLDPTWMWISQESHVLFSTSHLIWKYMLPDGLPFLSLA